MCSGVNMKAGNSIQWFHCFLSDHWSQLQIEIPHQTLTSITVLQIEITLQILTSTSVLQTGIPHQTPTAKTVWQIEIPQKCYIFSNSWHFLKNLKKVVGPLQCKIKKVWWNIVSINCSNVWCIEHSDKIVQCSMRQRSSDLLWQMITKRFWHGESITF